MSKIIINDPLLKNNILTSKITVSNDLKKYIKADTLFIEYDSEVIAEQSLLNLPLTAAILPLAWLTGSDIYVGSLDKQFKVSMDKLQKKFHEIYPLGSFTTNIHADKLVQNNVGEIDINHRTALFFSGGVDSTYSLVTNLEKNPRMVMVWGIANFPFPEHADHWEKVISIYTDYANRKNLKINIIKTNMSQILDTFRISHRFHRELHGDVRSAIQHTLMLVPISAPLSIGRFDRILFPASDHIGITDQKLTPRASIPELDEMIVWANLKVKHDGYIVRNQKIFGAISEYLKNENITINVCVNSVLVNGKVNCSQCEKCLRTIAPLVLSGYDPNNLGFNVDESTFEKMKSLWLDRKLSGNNNHWLSLREAIPEYIEDDIYGSREFFNWFRDYDFQSVKEIWFWLELYMRLPYPLAKQIDRVYRKFGIWIHDGPFNRTVERSRKLESANN